MARPAPRARKRARQASRASVIAPTEYPVVGAPVVFTAEELDLRVKRNARRGSSRAARRVESIERHVSRAVDRVASAVDAGVSKYVKRRDESACRRRDGAIVDFYENAARGVARAIADASPVLTDIAKIINTRRSRKAVRQTLKRLPRIPFLL